MVLLRKWILVLVICCLIGTIAQACYSNDAEEKCYEEEKDEVVVEENQYEEEISGTSITESKWFMILERLIERYPIIERIIERIFQWIFNIFLGIEY